jgi:hypothetical protein
VDHWNVEKWYPERKAEQDGDQKPEYIRSRQGCGP